MDQFNNLSEGLRKGEAISTAFMRTSCNPLSRHLSNWRTSSLGTTNAPKDCIQMTKNLQTLNRKANRELQLFSQPLTKVQEQFPGDQPREPSQRRHDLRRLRGLGPLQLYRHRQLQRRANRSLLRIPCRKILMLA